MEIVIEKKMIIGKTPKANEDISPVMPPKTNKAPLLTRFQFNRDSQFDSRILTVEPRES